MAGLEARVADSPPLTVTVTLTNSALTTFTITRVKMAGKAWIKPGNPLWSSAPTTPVPGEEVGLFAYVTWGVTTGSDGAAPAGEIVLDGSGDPLTVQFINRARGDAECICESTAAIHAVVQPHPYGDPTNARFSIILTRQR